MIFVVAPLETAPATQRKHSNNYTSFTKINVGTEYVVLSNT